MSNYEYKRAYENARNGGRLGNTNGMPSQARESAEAGNKAGQKK